MSWSGRTSSIGARVRLGPHVVIGDGATLGDDVRLDAHVTLYDGVVLGSRVWCKASAVIGGAGFGFNSDASGHHRVPQVGGCILEDDVEVGSCSCVDRGSLDDTVIGRGTKLDNHVHVAHNVRMGSDCLLVAGDRRSPAVPRSAIAWCSPGRPASVATSPRGRRKSRWQVGRVRRRRERDVRHRLSGTAAPRVPEGRWPHSTGSPRTCKHSKP